jgi:pimeloyl-ACP methyl ester carboxylesterase
MTKHTIILLIITMSLSLPVASYKVSANPAIHKPVKQVYFISGLGADKRVFEKLNLHPSISVRHIEWVKPLRKETIAHYASRLIAQMDTTRPFVLVGLSFGGIIASELADIISPEKVIIISSTSTGVPVSPFNQKLLKFLLASPLAAPILKHPSSLVYNYFGANTPELKLLLDKILKDTDAKFLKWALAGMSKWSRHQKIPGLYHIHGSADKLIPLKLVSPNAIIENGGHLMVYAQAGEISELINAEIYK